MDKLSFLSLYFAHRLLWLKLFQSRVIVRRTGQAGMSSIAWPGSRTRAVRLCLHAKTALSRNVYHTAMHSFKFMMSNSNGANVNDRCRVCAFVFVNKTRKRIIDGEVYNQNVREDDGFPRAVCNPCHCRVEAMWIQASVVNPSHHLSKRRHPLSPLTSSQLDEQTASQISEKKGYIYLVKMCKGQSR